MTEAAFNWKHAGRRWLKPVTLVLLLLPAIWLLAHWIVLILYVTGNPAPGADLLLRGPWLPSGNPVQTTHHFLGETAIRILLVTLAIRPVKELTGWAPLMIVRRRVGLAAFFYALAHMLAYFGLDLFFSVARLLEDVADRFYITLGMAALILLAPLAITSTNGMIKRLGARRWRRLHMLIYPLAALAVGHHFFAEKGLQPGPLIHAAILALLLSYRFFGWTKKRRQRAAPATAAA